MKNLIDIMVGHKRCDGRIIHRSFSRNSDMPKFYKRKSNKKSDK